MNQSTSVTATIKSFNDDSPNGAFDCILSTADLDRDGEVVSPDSWALPLPDSIPLNVDHSKSVEDIVASGRPWLDANGNLRVSGTFASTPQAQHIRSLVADKHLRTVSVEFLRRKGTSGKPVNELLAGAFVSIPSNPNALILSAKSAAFSTAVRAIIDGKSYEDASGAMVQAIHDTSSRLGAECMDGQDGAADGANKGSRDDITDDDDDGDDYEYDERALQARALMLRIKALRR